MGGIAAEALAVAAHAETERGEKFLSKDDIRQKAKVSQTVLDTMAELGLLGGLPESNQLSIFDLVLGGKIDLKNKNTRRESIQNQNGPPLQKNI